MQKDIPSEEIKTGEEDDDDNGDNLLKDSNDSKSERSLIQTVVFHNLIFIHLFNLHQSTHYQEYCGGFFYFFISSSLLFQVRAYRARS